MDVSTLIAALVLVPAICALLCLAIPHKSFRNTLVILAALIMVSASSVLAYMVITSQGALTIPVHTEAFELFGWVIKAADLVVLFYVIARGLADKRYLSPLLAVLQLSALCVFELLPLLPFTGLERIHEPMMPIALDHLSMILILLASVIGPTILIFAIGYMEAHEAHLHLTKSRQPRFFAILFLFLCAMNALALSDNLLWMYTFWEITTLCSFLLISHDGTAESIRNAFRTLDLNMIGGVAFILAIIIGYYTMGSLTLSELTSHSLSSGVTGLFTLSVALLCLAGFTKSAQFPFQSWLLGAMVAPTPVSALLHSSTMVKAGVYLVVRLSPVLAGSMLGSLVAVAGGFTFMAASAIAISQRNGKRVLAYSTIANLGLIVCCAGIGTYVAVAAAVLLMIFHAVSKGLLFLCMGTVEQGIGSRDIEDMQGLLKKMPFTTFIMVIGMISMMLPPFGVLITKWLAMETAVHLPLVLLFLILGSAFTVFFWAKWIGIILTMSYKSKYVLEKQSPSIRFSLSFLLLGVAAVTCGIAPLFQTLVAPYLNQVVSAADRLRLIAQDGGLWLFAQNNLSPWEMPVRVGGFSSVPLVFLVFALVCAVPYFIHRTRPERVKPPYFGGDLANNDIRGIEFIGPGEKIENIVVHNYYLAGTFSEEHLSFLTSAIALAIILIMFGVSY